jgi:exodeoxyribonuclease VII large subunit
VRRLTVSGLAQEVDRLLQRAYPQLAVEGEVSQIQVPASGHAYLVLREQDAVLQVVVWRTDWAQVQPRPAIGDRVVCHGKIGGYPTQGRYQMYATRVEPVGAGELQKQLEAIRQRLRADGLLDPRRRRPLPRFPAFVGLATSPTGAALQDFLRVSRERWPAARILLAPCTVQGADAAGSVVRALELLFEDGRSDVVVVARGGGSEVDLLPFQDEQLARWIATGPVPVVTAVGHEIDTTIADLAADATAPTPSVAAVRVLPDGPAFTQRVDEAASANATAIGRLLHRRRGRLADLEARLLHPARSLRSVHVRRDELESRLHAATLRRLAGESKAVRAAQERLAALSPLGVLHRGYAIVTGRAGVVRRPSDVAAGDPVTLRVAEGSIAAVVRPPEA